MVNQLPQGWKEEELGKHSYIKRGSTITKKQVVHGEYPVVAGGKEAAYYHNEYNREAPVITISGSGANAGYVNYWGVPIFASDCSTLEEKDLNIKYLYYFLKSKQQMLLDKQVGVAIPHVSPKDISSLLIPYPTNKEEQKYIVDTLDTVAETIGLRKETIQLTKDLIPSIFQEMFGDCLQKVYLGDNEYFEIEDGDRGSNYPKKEELSTIGDCLFLSAKNVTENGFIFKENLFISHKKDQQLRSGKLKRHDLVMMTRGTIGNIAYYSSDTPYENIRINSGMVILRIKKGFEPLYFLHAMNSDEVKFQIKNLITGAAVPQLPIHLIKEISLPLAIPSKQKEFAAKIEQINQYIAEQQKELEYFENLFQSLLQEAFTGKLTKGKYNGKQ